MSILNDIKQFVAEQRNDYESADSDDKMFMLVIGTLITVGAALLVFAILAILWAIAKTVFPFALAAAAFYVFGIFKWGWKAPRIKRK